MPVTANAMRTKLKRAFVLPTVLVLLAVAVFASGALVTVSLIEGRVSVSQADSVTAYYTAEAGARHALQKLNTTSGLLTKLAAGTLGVSDNYTITNPTGSGTEFNVEYISTSANNAEILVSAEFDTGKYVAERVLRLTVYYLSSSTNPLTDVGFLAGGAININNGSGAIRIIGGDLFSNGSIALSSTTLTLDGTEFIRTPGTYTANGSTVTSGGIRASNYPPAPSSIGIGSYQFGNYAGNGQPHCSWNQFAGVGGTLYCHPTNFTNLINDYFSRNPSSNTMDINSTAVVLTGSGAVSVPTGKTVEMGHFVVRGNLTIQNPVQCNRVRGVTTCTQVASGTLRVDERTVTTPNHSGIFVEGSCSMTGGVVVVYGVLYCTGNASLTVPSGSSLTVTGGVLSTQAATLSNAGTFQVTYDLTAINTSGVPTTTNVGVAVVTYWEEEY